MSREDELVNEMGLAIGRHADWLDGEAFLKAAIRAAESYFDDFSGEPEGGLMAEFLRQALDGLHEDLSEAGLINQMGGG